WRRRNPGAGRPPTPRGSAGVPGPGRPPGIRGAEPERPRKSAFAAGRVSLALELDQVLADPLGVRGVGLERQVFPERLPSPVGVLLLLVAEPELGERAGETGERRGGSHVG